MFKELLYLKKKKKLKLMLKVKYISVPLCANSEEEH